MKLYNTLTKSKETLIPCTPGKVGMYVCGPTVYDRAHIGNARAVVVFDALLRTLQHEYGQDNVTYVRNITDVDDKINAAAKQRNVSINTVTEETTKMFHDDMGALNCLAPTIEPRATTHIPHMIKMIENLIENKFAYEAQGHVLFSVKEYEDYGKLSRRSVEEMIAGARVEIAPYKKDAADFVLWKPSSNDEPGWDSPWGYGRPGWHIECSAMATEYLGETFDIHGGGADLQFPHHENEIAQSCCANKGSKYAKTWVHNGFLSVDGEKMSKSLGNFITVNDLLEKNVKGEVIRFALLSTHYRKPLDWTEKAISDAKIALDKFYAALRGQNFDKNYKKTPICDTFIEALQDDLNTPKAISILHKMAKDKSSAHEDLKYCGKILGILQDNPDKWLEKNISDIDESLIEELVQKRIDAKKNKDWSEADKIRDELKSMSITLEDRPDGTTSWKKS
ncbi:cysteine--tRNA ligase [Rickettsiales bacterium]|nr:cysteine--tRNA ligase [Rickettsiales bacterium]